MDGSAEKTSAHSISKQSISTRFIPQTQARKQQDDELASLLRTGSSEFMQSLDSEKEFIASDRW